MGTRHAMLLLTLVSLALPVCTVPAAAVAIADRTGVLPQDQLQTMLTQLKLLRDRKGISLGVVARDAMSAQEARTRAADARKWMLSQGSLPTVSGLLLFTGSSLTYERDNRLLDKLPWSLVMQIWQQIPTGPVPAENARRWVEGLCRYFGLLGGQTPTPTPVSPVATPGTVTAHVCSRYEEVKGRIGPQNPTITLGGEPLKGVSVSFSYTVNGTPRAATVETNAKGNASLSVPYNVTVTVSARTDTKTATCTPQQPLAYAAFGWQGHDPTR